MEQNFDFLQTHDLCSMMKLLHSWFGTNKSFSFLNEIFGFNFTNSHANKLLLNNKLFTPPKASSGRRNKNCSQHQSYFNFSLFLLHHLRVIIIKEKENVECVYMCKLKMMPQGLCKAQKQHKKCGTGAYS